MTDIVIGQSVKITQRFRSVCAKTLVFVPLTYFNTVSTPAMRPHISTCFTDTVTDCIARPSRSSCIRSWCIIGYRLHTISKAYAGRRSKAKRL